MLKTPDTIRERFGIEPELGRGRAVPRVLFSYHGPAKAELLASLVALTIHGELPAWGDSRRGQREMPQHQLAAGAGVSRSTLTRRLSRFAPLVDFPEDQRQRLSRGGKERARRRGLRVRAGELAPRRLPVAVILHRRQRFAQPNRYSYALPQRRDPDRPERWFPPTLEQLAAHPEFRGLFREIGLASGYKHVPEWLFDPRLPLSDTARLVMTYYALTGLLERGETHPRQATVARACGIDERTLYAAHLELNGDLRADGAPAGSPPKWGVRIAGTIATIAWYSGPEADVRARAHAERENALANSQQPTANGRSYEAFAIAPIALIRVAHFPARFNPHNRTWKPPRQRIIYLPMRLLSREEAEREKTRFRRAVEAFSRQPWAARARTLHAELLAAWTAQEHTLQGFWSEFRRRCHSAGISREAAAALCPSAHPNPPPDD